MLYLLSGICVGVLVLIAYRLGLHDGRKKETEPVIKPLFNFPKGNKDKEPTAEEKLLDWAERYNG